MNDIKKEVEQFLGNKSLFTKDTKKRMIQEITSKEEKKTFRFLIPSVALMIVSIAAILTLSIITPTEKSPSTSTPDPAPPTVITEPEEEREEEEIVSLIQDEEAEKLKIELERFSQRYFLCFNCYGVEDNFISNTIVDWDSHRNLYVEFPDGYRFEENEWSYVSNVVYSELINYGFTDKGSEVYQLVFHAITKENDAFNIHLQFQKEDDKWLISHIKDQRIKPKVILDETVRNQIDYTHTAGMFFDLEQHGERIPELEKEINELLSGELSSFGFANMLNGIAINEKGVAVIEFADLRSLYGSMTSNESGIIFQQLVEVIWKYPEIQEVYFTLNGSFTAWAVWLESSFDPIKREDYMAQ